MNKTICFLFFGVFMPSMLYSYPFVFQWYAPSLFDSSFGGTVYHQFEKEVGSQILIPYETKFYLNKMGNKAVSGNIILSQYYENDAFASLNLSLGLGRSNIKEGKSPLQGVYYTLYPAYEWPVIALGKTPIWNWKSAADMGYAFVLSPEAPVYLSIYGRLVCAWTDSIFHFLPFPNFGITLGWHFTREWVHKDFGQKKYDDGGNDA
jgi:hypothetical protein